LHVAKLLNGTAVVTNGFHNGGFGFTDKKGVQRVGRHPGSNEYHDLALLLGINVFSLPETQVLRLSWPDVVFLHEYSIRGSSKPLCNTTVYSDYWSCPGIRWCGFRVPYDSVAVVKTELLSGGAREKCIARGMGFRSDLTTLKVSWHLRNGDICLHCDDANEYVTRIYDALLGSPTFAANHDIYFESSVEMHAISLQVAAHANFHYFVNASLVETVCRFLTSDVLITSGSSLPVMVAAFSRPWYPIVIEEQRKEAAWVPHIQKHMLPAESAFQMADGRPTSPTFVERLESVLAERKRAG